ncbi:ATP-binding protein [Streptomyces erythrochromogenes]|uniref:ATP-binding protein n=1 Tax=Streptomyces erythrochromogenes TaxID=285574 RepID=UPI00367A66CF
MSAPQGEVALEDRIAQKANVPIDDVRDVFAAYGLPLVVSPARARPLRVHRLRLAGERTGDVQPGPFDTSLDFSEGLTAFVASNFRGKSSVLELVTWCLRGTRRDALQTRVRHWLRHVDLDATVAGTPMAFRLDLAEGEIDSAVVLTGPDHATLEEVRAPDPGRGITALLRAASTASYAEQIAGLMLGRMDLQPLLNSRMETSTTTHGWPAYFGAIYLPTGADRPLMGDVMTDGLPGRLLQVFLDLPAAAALTRVKTVHDVRLASNKARRKEADAAAAARTTERARLQDELGRAQDLLAGLSPSGTSEVSLVDLAHTAMDLAQAVADAQDVWEEADRTFRRARTERQHAAKLLNDVTESATARLLFHGLNPTSCPRCDQSIDDERRREERQAHTCAVCAREVVGDDEDPQFVTAEAEIRLEAASAAEKAAKNEREQAQTAVRQLTGQLEEAQAELRRAQSAADLPARLAAHEAVLRLEGALSVLEAPQESPLDEAEEKAIRILAAAATLLDDDSKTTAAKLFEEINAEIASLATRFGVPSLESVSIDRAARLKIYPVGSAQEWFKGQTAGAKLRLRVAVAIALLRIGRSNGVSTHPGLLLIDSPKSEEMQSADAHKLFRELAAVAADSELQVLLTTADFELANASLPKDTIRQAAEGAPLW